MGTWRQRSRVFLATLALIVLAQKSIAENPASQSSSQSCSLAATANLPKSAEGLLGVYRRQADQLRSLVIIGEFIAHADTRYGPKAGKAQEIPGYILIQQPGLVRIIGKEPWMGRDIFDVASDGKETRILIPFPFRFYIGPANSPTVADYPLTNMRPQHVSDALIWEKPSSHAVATFDKTSKVKGAASLRVADGDASPIRMIDFDRASGDVSKVEVRSASGSTVAIFRYAGWANTNGPAGSEPVCFPRHIWLERPQENYDLEIVVHRMDINQELPLARFHLDPPHGARVIRGENDITIAP